MFNDFEVKLTPESNWLLYHVHIYKGFYISPSENDYKNGIKIALDKENKYSISEVTTKEMSYFVLSVKSTDYEVLIRSNSRISLEYLIFHVSNMSNIGYFNRGQGYRKTFDILPTFIKHRKSTRRSSDKER
jgi:hypothetical protein